MKKKMESKRKFYRGMAMGEALIGVFIVGTTIIAFLSVLSKMFYVEFNKRDYIIATNLAQEGVEIVRNFRDNNWKANPPRNAFDAAYFPANGCHNMDYLTLVGTPTTCSCPNCLTNNPLRRSDSGFYAHSAGTATTFYRRIRIQDQGGGKLVTSVVRFRPKGATADQEITITDTLYPWGDIE